MPVGKDLPVSEDANLEGANLEDATLYDANLQGATYNRRTHFTYANITQEQLDSMVSSEDYEDDEDDSWD